MNKPSNPSGSDWNILQHLIFGTSKDTNKPSRELCMHPDKECEKFSAEQGNFGLGGEPAQTTRQRPKGPALQGTIDTWTRSIQGQGKVQDAALATIPCFRFGGSEYIHIHVEICFTISAHGSFFLLSLKIPR